MLTNSTSQSQSQSKSGSQLQSQSQKATSEKTANTGNYSYKYATPSLTPLKPLSLVPMGSQSTVNKSISNIAGIDATTALDQAPALSLSSIDIPYTSTNTSRTSTVSIINMSKKRLRWNDIVTTPMGYEAFMNHLETEFSNENLMMVTEV